MLSRQNLDQDQQVKEYVITTIVYGVKSAGNQTIAGLNMLAGHVVEEKPIAAHSS